MLHISRENMREEKFGFVCFVTANMLCTTTHSHKPEFFLSQIFSWLCSSVYSTECGVMQNFAELWHNFENAVIFYILNKIFLCLQVECSLWQSYDMGLQQFLLLHYPKYPYNECYPKGAFLGHQGGVVRLWNPRESILRVKYSLVGPFWAPNTTNGWSRPWAEGCSERSKLLSTV